MMPNGDQVNTDGDLEGDACDTDDDNDGFDDIVDDCRLGTIGVDVCDDDQDGDILVEADCGCDIVQPVEDVAQGIAPLLIAGATLALRRRRAKKDSHDE